MFACASISSARLRELGANPEVQTATVARHSPFGPDTWAVVNNIVAKIPGTQPTGAVMMVAHYDSVPSGPGAGDDAASVAAILEALRALKAGPALRNDLIVLFTDGEELGLLGAKGFVETYPTLDNIKVVLNFEMRGDYGPSMMFQTSAHNSWLVDQLAAAAPFPYATSAAPTVYKRLPNDTDLTVFLDAGMAGMNFAAAGGITRYHTALDNADLLDQRTLQHQGSYALSLARRFGSIDLNAPRTGRRSFLRRRRRVDSLLGVAGDSARDRRDDPGSQRDLDWNSRRTIQHRRYRRGICDLRDRSRGRGRRSARSVVADERRSRAGECCQSARPTAVSTFRSRRTL